MSIIENEYGVTPKVRIEIEQADVGFSIRVEHSYRRNAWQHHEWVMVRHTAEVLDYVKSHLETDDE